MRNSYLRQTSTIVIFHQEDFTSTTFLGKSHFSGTFEDITYWKDVTFENPNKNIFDVRDMSKVSFVNADITGIRFNDNICSRYSNRNGRS